MESEFLKSLVIIFGISAVVVFLLQKLKIPSIVGFLVAGVIISPYGIGLVKDTHAVEMLAEIGVILLLFTIGIEFSMKKLLRMKKAVIVGGGVQVLLTITLSAVAAYLVTGHTNKSIFFGFLIALSSTAIVLKMLTEKGETDSPHGRIMTGILIFQDLCVVPLMLFIPVLSGEVINIIDASIKMAKAVLIIIAVLLSARWIVPSLLHQIVHTRSRELFITTIILLCLGIALLTSRFGISLALGAFLAGLIISESEYAHQATADILPFKETFIGLFFVSVGMLMDIGYVSDNYLKIAIAVILIFGLKIITGMFSAMLTGIPLRTSFHVGLGLAQVGEFSFVLAIAGKASGLITVDFYQVFLSSSVVTMIMTPFILKTAPSFSAWVISWHLLKKVGRLKKISEIEGTPRKRHGHVIIIGFGLNGRNLARVLREMDIPYVVLEMNSDTVLEMKKKGEPIYYGDGTSKEILHKLSIENARLLVIAISDPASTRRIVSIARHENPNIYIIVRTRYIAEVDDLRKLGADDVIPEEFETSIEIFSRVLHKYNFPNNITLDLVDKIRSDGYTALRSVDLPKKHLFEKWDWLPEIEIDGYKAPDASHLIGKSISELQIRKKTGVTIIAVRRGVEVFTNPAPEFRFKKADIILFTGERKSMDMALNYFKSVI
ncbi:MAG: cation:proton antiporter [Thermodesulfovibrionia bacterium]|nr:cation:proton antiporter [Thermodesulfovibrionia bacterium]